MDDQRLSACVVADYVGISMGRVVFSTCWEFVDENVFWKMGAANVV